MRVLIAPDKFKGSLTAAQVADEVAKGLAQTGAQLGLSRWPTAATVASPPPWLPDSIPTGRVHGATGEGHRGVVAFNGDTAIVEVANTCGLATLPGGILAPMAASSYGFGEAIRAALIAVPPAPGLRSRRQRQYRRRRRHAGGAGSPLP